MPRLQSLLIGITLFLSACSSDNDVSIPEESVFIFPEDLKGEWINEDENWGFRLSNSGTIEFLALNTESGQFVPYLDEVDSIFFIDSSRFVFRPVNCFYNSVFGEYTPIDTGDYYLNKDSLSLELIKFQDSEVISIPFLKRNQEISGDDSFLSAEIKIENESYEFKSNGLIENRISFNHIDSVNQLFVYSESTNFDCILLSQVSSFEILLGIEDYQGVNVYPVMESSKDLRYDDPSWLMNWRGDIGDQYLLSGEIEIIEHSSTQLKGRFWVDLVYEEDTLGSIEGGSFEIYQN